MWQIKKNMRKGKGYQKDIYKSWNRKKQIISSAKGHNETIEQYIAHINECFDKRIKHCIESYDKITSKTTLTGKSLYEYCHSQQMWDVQFNNDWTLVPLDEALKRIEEDRRKTLGRLLYSGWHAYQKRIVHKDNQKFVYNTSGGDGYFGSIRVPSLKRSKATWKRFYELFPEAKGLKTFRGFKLKQIN